VKSVRKNSRLASDESIERLHGTDHSELSPSSSSPQANELIQETPSKRSESLLLVINQAIRYRMWLLAIGHILAFSLIYWLAFALRFDFRVPAYFVAVFTASLPYVIVIKVVVFYALGHYHGWWRHVTFADLVALLRAAALSILVLVAFERLNLFFSELPRNIPRSIFILDPILTVVLLGLFRSSWRLLQEGAIPVFGKRNQDAALLVGANHASARLANAIHAHPELPFSIRGFLAVDERVRRGTRLGQIPVLGTVSDVATIATATKARVVLVTAGTVSGSCLRELMQVCDEARLDLKIIPPVEGLFDGNRRIPLRDLNINDLLRREPVELDSAAIGALVSGKTVMVTGAGGSIGSEICRQVLNFRPKSLILVGRGENRIFEVERELRSRCEDTKLEVCIADITDAARMRVVFESHPPEIVFHAAAHKHVPLMERNVGEAIKNNVFGTKCVADLASEFGVKRFVMISTDKAVHPSSIMGVSKHIAERYVYTMSQESQTRFMVTRFGNVLGSAGSVVPIFQEQIARGGPITVTHPEMTRFFMTIPEASQLVLQAATMGRGGEIFVLEMGKPVRIVDLAKDLIALSGLPEDSVDIVFTGMRPGEKLHEELYFESEEMLETTHPKLQVAYHRPFSLDEIRDDIRELRQLCHGPEEAIRAKLKEIVPEYGHVCQRNGKSAERVEPSPTEAAVRPV
jgi:FlaA1/EpsC-like NDP-sugar epimerase